MDALSPIARRFWGTFLRTKLYPAIEDAPALSVHDKTSKR